MKKHTIITLAILLAGFAANANGNTNDHTTDMHSTSSETDRTGMVVHSSVRALPIIYITISANLKNKDVQIDWVAVEESDIENYEIERSVDGFNFTTEGKVTSRADNSGESYHWLDANPKAGNNYYRVRATHVNGILFVSKTIVVSSNEKPTIKIFPNPVKNQQINLRSHIMEKGKYTLFLRDTRGQLVLSRVIDHPGGKFSQVIYIGKMVPPGMYYLKIANEKVEYSQPVFVQ